MSDGRNLWIGAALGMLLTGGLMFALYQQSGLADAAQTMAGKAAVEQPEAAAVFAPMSADGGNNDGAVPVNTPGDQHDDSISAVAGVLGEESVPASEFNALPELELSPAELSAMSAAEREQYEVMLQSYREVRAQVLALDQERAALKQRMDGMFEQNDAMEQEIERMRVLLEQLPAKTE